MGSIADDLLKLKTHIEKSRTEAARLEGQISQLEKQRAEEFGCADDDQAEAYIRELEASVSELEAEIQSGVAVVKEELNWP